MTTSLGQEPFQILPLRSRITSFEHEERAVQQLATALGAPVERAAAPSIADGLLLCSGGVEEECVHLLRAGASRVLLAAADQNAYAAGAEVAAWGRREGMPVRLQPLGTHAGPETRSWLKAQRARNHLQDARLGLISGSARWLVASLPAADLLSRRFGVSLVQLDQPELAEGIGEDFPFRKAPEARRWTSMARDAGVSTHDMRRTLGFSAALGQLVRKRGFQAVAVDCFQLIGQLHLSACLALADLSEGGIPAACEGDVVSALALLLAREVTGQVSWMGNLALMEESTIWLAHCTAPPSLTESFRLSRHFETGTGVAVAATFPAGQQVTVLRLDDRLESAVLVRGRTREASPLPHLCRTQVCVDLDAPLPEVLGNHHVLVIGDHVQPLAALLQLSGIRIL